jgi:Na+-transporting NADH:ubiquinone oxidoreductase subunit NqrF
MKMDNLIEEMLAALKSAELVVEEACHGQDPDNQCWVVLSEVREAIAKTERASKPADAIHQMHMSTFGA